MANFFSVLLMFDLRKTIHITADFREMFRYFNGTCDEIVSCHDSEVKSRTLIKYATQYEDEKK